MVEQLQQRCWGDFGSAAAIGRCPFARAKDDRRVGWSRRLRAVHVSIVPPGWLMIWVLVPTFYVVFFAHSLGWMVRRLNHFFWFPLAMFSVGGSDTATTRAVQLLRVVSWTRSVKKKHFFEIDDDRRARLDNNNGLSPSWAQAGVRFRTEEQAGCWPQFAHECQRRTGVCLFFDNFYTICDECFRESFRRRSNINRDRNSYVESLEAWQKVQRCNGLCWLLYTMVLLSVICF